MIDLLLLLLLLVCYGPGSIRSPDQTPKYCCMLLIIVVDPDRWFRCCSFAAVAVAVAIAAAISLTSSIADADDPDVAADRYTAGIADAPA